MKNKLKRLYLKIFKDYIQELKVSLKGCKTVLDIGCGDSSPIQTFSKNIYSVGVDAFLPNIEKSKELRIHNKYFKLNVLDINKKFKPNSFECVLASDLIEHLTKKEGIKLIEMMEKIAKNKVIIFTPNGFLPQGEHDENPWQVHKSGWTAKEMERRKYRVIGINGWKPLRGESASIKFWPKYFWKIISDITQFFVRNKPGKAYQILCIKTKNLKYIK